ncbi:MAG: tetratricopeptide repeat protein [Melioribacteraceae bacterium]|nr:tetratricopeptide repeat protein [Melioribacteraceae bacterium]
MGIDNINLHIESKLKRANLFISERKYLHAIQIYKKLILRRQEEKIATIKLAELFEKLNKTDSVVNIYKYYFSNHTNDLDIFKLLIFFQMRNNLYSDAIELMDFNEDLIDEELHYIRAKAYFHLDEFDIAELKFSHFNSAYPVSKLLPDALTYLSRILVIKNDYDNALKNIKKVIDFSTQNSDAHLLEAEIYFRKGMYLHADKSISKSLNLNPSDSESSLLQIKIFIELGELEKADTSLRNLIDTSEPNAELYTIMGMTYFHKMKLDEARKYFEKALQLEPNFLDAVEGLKMCNSK